MLLLDDGQKRASAGRHSRDMDWYVRLGLVSTLCFVGATVAWGVAAPLEGAVIAPGTLVVETAANKIQHPTGGVVGTVLVKEGQRVKSGDVLIRLDETATRAALQIVSNELKALRARQVRLAAERDGLTEYTPPEDMRRQAETDAEMRQALQSEASLFAARARTRIGQRNQYSEQIKQLQQEIIGNEAQTRSARDQLRVAELEMKDMQGLLAKQLVQRQRVTQLEREIARIGGTIGELGAKIAQIRARISETELLILQIDRTLETEVARELRETETKINEQIERLTTAEDQLRRIDLRAPRDGIVHQLQVINTGGVISPGALVMNIVPEQDTLLIEARVNPIDIDQLYADQPARVRFSAFTNRATPELNGSVFRIGADIVKDERTGASHYIVAVRIPDEERARLGSLRLIPGMPAEAFIKTQERTVASFLVKPLLDHMNRAFREK